VLFVIDSLDAGNLEMFGLLLTSSTEYIFAYSQGYILNPLLFLFYVNDMLISINSDCNLLLYANNNTI